MESGFNIRALEDLIIPKIVKAIVAEAEADMAAKQGVEAGKEAVAEEVTTAEVATNGRVVAKGIATVGKIA